MSNMVITITFDVDQTEGIRQGCAWPRQVTVNLDEALIASIRNRVEAQHRTEQLARENAEKAAEEERARQEREAREAAQREALRQWALAHGSELLRERIECGFDWRELAQNEYALAHAPKGHGLVQDTDESSPRKRPTLPELRELKNSKSRCNTAPSSTQIRNCIGTSNTDHTTRTGNTHLRNNTVPQVSACFSLQEVASPSKNDCGNTVELHDGLEHCPWCGENGGVLIGPLGFLRRFRCIYCGGQFSHQTKRRKT